MKPELHDTIDGAGHWIMTTRSGTTHEIKSWDAPVVWAPHAGPRPVVPPMTAGPCVSVGSDTSKWTARLPGCVR
jgi:hypothetical protein